MLTQLKKIHWLQYIYLAWFGSILATIGSLIYSDIIHVPICPLCWYQRILMYPLIVIFAVGIILRDKKCVYYALPLILFGTLIALYQVLLQAQIIPQTIFGCSVDSSVSCADITFKLFGFLTIPQQALLGFAGIFGVSVLGLVGRD